MYVCACLHWCVCVCVCIHFVCVEFWKSVNLKNVKVNTAWTFKMGVCTYTHTHTHASVQKQIKKIWSIQQSFYAPLLVPWSIHLYTNIHFAQCMTRVVGSSFFSSGGNFSFFLFFLLLFLFLNLDQFDDLANNRKSIHVLTATVSSHPCWKITNLPGQYKHPLL